MLGFDGYGFPFVITDELSPCLRGHQIALTIMVVSQFKGMVEVAVAVGLGGNTASTATSLTPSAYSNRAVVAVGGDVVVDDGEEEEEVEQEEVEGAIPSPLVGSQGRCRFHPPFVSAIIRNKQEKEERGRPRVEEGGKGTSLLGNGAKP